MRRRILVAALAATFASCGGVSPRLGPIPSEPSSIQGDGSLTLSGPDGSGRSRFAFVLLPPGRARIDVFDPLGRLAYFLLVADSEALLAVPSKRVFGRSSRDDVFARFLGFGLSASEMASLLTGSWPDGAATEDAPGWILHRDGRNRVAAAERGELRLEIREFFGDSPAPRLVAFTQAGLLGRLKIRRLAFDGVGPGAADEAVLLKGYRERPWLELEALFGDED
ncbi:MAG: hypothetical protein JW742_03785 [Candidatus Aminicenantes bacterium]|nr:hypothetical protein [Candidatus Aminicenantes bacterium]